MLQAVDANERLARPQRLQHCITTGLRCRPTFLQHMTDLESCLHLLPLCSAREATGLQEREYLGRHLR